MLRAYLVIIVVIGVAASMMRGSEAPQASTEEIHLVQPAQAQGEAQAGDGANQVAANLQDGEVALQRAPNGHFYADVEINGAQVHMLVDTGATGIALSREDARAAGIATSIGMNDVVGQGADGSVHGEYVTLDRVTLGHKTVEQMQAMVLNSGGQSLLGQSFLAQFSSVEIHRDTMTLR
jgi:aspartyl protease family protein